MNINWNANITPVAKGNKLFEIFDICSYQKIVDEYIKLDSAQKSIYKGQEDYVVQHGGPDLSSLNRNYKKMRDEIDSRLSSGSIPEILTIDMHLQERLIPDLLCSLENDNYIKEIYPTKKMRVRDGLNTTEANVLMECIRQGRSLLQAGREAGMIAKPLIDFYAASAYAYAIIVINSPLHKSIASLKGSHGHSYDHKNSSIDFGGNVPSGTFLDLLGAIPVAHITTAGINLKYSLIHSIDMVQNNNVSISLLSLLAMVPEINKLYELYDNKHRCVHKLNVDIQTVNAKATYNFYIGDGIHRPNLNNLKEQFKTENIKDNYGSFIVSVAMDDIKDICPTIYQDARGHLWYVESPIEGLVLPEICLHFLIISALCNIMRYSPHEWSNILNNKISSPFSLLISEYIRLFEEKFPMLVVQYLTNYLPILSE